MMSYKKKNIVRGESDKRYVYYWNSDRKRTALQILRQRPVTLLVRVGWGLDGVFGRQQEPMGVFFTQQLKEVEQLTLFVNLMQAHGILLGVDIGRAGCEACSTAHYHLRVYSIFLNRPLLSLFWSNILYAYATHIFILDFIVLAIFVEEYKLYTYSLFAVFSILLSLSLSLAKIFLLATSVIFFLIKDPVTTL
jgi:hypothetical protein